MYDDGIASSRSTKNANKGGQMLTTCLPKRGNEADNKWVRANNWLQNGPSTSVINSVGAVLLCFLLLLLEANHS